ncbi:MAG: IS607 family transposase [Patescibacteria group bacterium]|nr:IS607 family transposase [Patescibacteria group bacterium]
MKQWFRISEAAQLLGVCSKTIRRWDQAQKIRCQRTVGNHRRIALIEVQRLQTGQTLPEGQQKVAIYARVSSHDQKKKGDLARQVQTIQATLESQEKAQTLIFTDVGSGLNTKRRGLNKLCQLIELGQIQKVILTYPDRLTRFGFAYLQKYFQSHGTQITVLAQPDQVSIQHELVADLISIVTSFSGRVHGLRSHQKRKKFHPN